MFRTNPVVTGTNKRSTYQVHTARSNGARSMRKLVCDAAQAELFQTVITPHYDDALILEMTDT